MSKTLDKVRFLVRVGKFAMETNNETMFQKAHEELYKTIDQWGKENCCCLCGSTNEKCSCGAKK